jgi:hypothetical protein
MFVSPRASECALSYAHQVRNDLMIAANARTLNMTTLNWSQLSSILQLSCFAIYWTESILCNLGHMNHKSHSPQTKKVWSKKGLIRISPFGRLGSDVSIIRYWLVSYMTLLIWWCLNGSILTTLHLARTKPLEYKRIVICSVTRNKVSCR